MSKDERRWSMNQAIANTVIEGHDPTAEFLADCEAVVDGRMTHEEAGARSLARALRNDAATDTRTKPEADAA